MLHQYYTQEDIDRVGEFTMVPCMPDTRTSRENDEATVCEEAFKTLCCINARVALVSPRPIGTRAVVPR